MPFVESEFVRIWQLVDQFSTDDAVRRADLDVALDDIASGMNAQSEYIQGMIGVATGWVDKDTFLADIKGPQGPRGLRGVEGASAFQAWLDDGNVGTETDFLESLRVPMTVVSIPTSGASIGTYQGGAVYHTSDWTALGSRTLPEATVGRHLKICITTNYMATFSPATGENFIGAAANKYIESDEIGASIDLICLRAGEWFYDAKGTWTVEP